MFSHLDANTSAVQLHISQQTQLIEGVRGQSPKAAQGHSKESLSPSLWGCRLSQRCSGGKTVFQFALGDACDSRAGGWAAGVSPYPDLQPATPHGSGKVLCQIGVVRPIVLEIEMVVQCPSQVLPGCHGARTAEGFGGIPSPEW